MIISQLSLDWLLFSFYIVHTSDFSKVQPSYKTVILHSLWFQNIPFQFYFGLWLTPIQEYDPSEFVMTKCFKLQLHCWISDISLSKKSCLCSALKSLDELQKWRFFSTIQSVQQGVFISVTKASFFNCTAAAAALTHWWKKLKSRWVHRSGEKQ